MEKRAGEADAIGIISNLYTVILRQGYLEIYETSQGAWDQRTIPDVLFTPTEVKAVQSFLEEWLLPEA